MSNHKKNTRKFILLSVMIIAAIGCIFIALYSASSKMSDMQVRINEAMVSGSYDTHSNCTAQEFMTSRFQKMLVQTTCGDFFINSEMHYQIELGHSYNFEVTKEDNQLINLEEVE